VALLPAHLLITCVPEVADLTTLRDRIREEPGRPVTIEVWESGSDLPPPRQAIERLLGEVTGAAGPSRTPR